MTKRFGPEDLKALMPLVFQEVDDYVLEPVIHWIFYNWPGSLMKFTDDDITDFRGVAEDKSMAVVRGKIVEISGSCAWFLHYNGYRDQTLVGTMHFSGEGKGIGGLIRNLNRFIERIGLEEIKKQAGKLLIRDCTCDRHLKTYEFYSVMPELSCHD